MSEWWQKYEGLIPGAGIFFPEEDWLKLTSVTGQPLFTYRYPCQNPRAVVYLYHGLNVHANSLSLLAKRFAEERMMVLSFDFENHGRSGGERGRLRNLRNYVDDAVNYIQKSKEFYPDLPVFLCGMSMGGYVAACVSLKVPDLSGMILLCPGLGVAPNFKPCLRRLVKLINWVYPGAKVASTDLKTLSRNPHIEAYSTDDPHAYTGKMDAGTGVAFLRGFDELEAQYRNVNTPLYIIQGGVDNIASVDVVNNFMNTVPVQDKKLYLVEEMYHAVEVEPNIFELLENMVAWINQRI